MILSNTAVKLREKEAKAQRVFLTYSLISSITLHTTLLVLINGLWRKVPQIKDNPIEFTVITKSVETKKPPQRKKSQIKSNSGSSGLSSGSNGKTFNKMRATGSQNTQLHGSLAKLPQAQNSTTQNVDSLKNLRQQPLKLTKPSTPVAKTIQEKVHQTQPNVIQNPPSQKLIDTIEQPSQQQVLTKPVDTKTPQVVKAFTPPVQKLPVEKYLQPQILAQPPKQVELNQRNASLVSKLIDQKNISSQIETSKPFTPAPSPSITGNSFSVDQLRGSQQLGTNVTRSDGNGVNNGNSRHGNGVGDGNGGNGNSRHGNGVGDGNGGNGEENGIVTDPKPSIATGLQLNPADCDRCSIEYPDSARRRHIEGSPEVVIDHDENGKVTNVQLIRSSGSVELDEALLQQARNFKLKPNIGGRKGVRVTADFAVRGSQRHKQRQQKYK